MSQNFRPERVVAGKRMSTTLDSFCQDIDTHGGDAHRRKGPRKVHGNVRKCLVVNGATELWPPISLRLSRAYETKVKVTIAPHVWKLGRDYEHLRAEWKSRHPSEVSREKLAIRGFRDMTSSGKQLEIVLNRTEWLEARAFHEAVERDETGNLVASAMKYLFDLERSPIPNIAVVHGILETSNNMLVLTQRSEAMHHYPLHWSASFEEGLDIADAEFGDAIFHAVAARGVTEELDPFGRAKPDNFVFLSIIGEHQILNVAVVIYGRIPVESLDLVKEWKHLSRSGQPEVVELAFVPFEPDSLARLALSPEYPLAQSSSDLNRWHPTSRYRILAAMLYRFGREETELALERNAKPF